MNNRNNNWTVVRRSKNNEYIRKREGEKEKMVQVQLLLIKNFTQMYHTLLRFWKFIMPFKLK